jgi:hypothetical protein
MLLRSSLALVIIVLSINASAMTCRDLVAPIAEPSLSEVLSTIKKGDLVFYVYNDIYSDPRFETRGAGVFNRRYGTNFVLSNIPTSLESVKKLRVAKPNDFVAYRIRSSSNDKDEDVAFAGVYSPMRGRSRIVNFSGSIQTIDMIGGIQVIRPGDKVKFKIREIPTKPAAPHQGVFKGIDETGEFAIISNRFWPIGDIRELTVTANK